MEVGSRSDHHGSNAGCNEGEAREGRQLKYISPLSRELGKGCSSAPSFSFLIKEGQW